MKGIDTLVKSINRDIIKTMIKKGDIPRECVKNEEILNEIDNELKSEK